MGYIKHDAVIATGWKYNKIEQIQESVNKLRERAPHNFPQLIVGPIPSAVNSYVTYILLPDGSNEGWSESELGDRLREDFINIFRGTHFDVVEVAFGGDFTHDGGPTAISRVQFYDD